LFVRRKQLLKEQQQPANKLLLFFRVELPMEQPNEEVQKTPVAMVKVSELSLVLREKIIILKKSTYYYLLPLSLWSCPDERC
jgi:hypothetical protein